MGWNPRPTRAILFLVLTLATAGCGNSPAPLSPVQGKVYYRGVPLQGGVIVFTPDPTRGGRGEPALAEIGPDGSYSLRTGGGSGAVPGWHRVTVATWSSSTLPAHFSDPELSGELREIKPDRANFIDIRLE